MLMNFKEIAGSSDRFPCGTRKAFLEKHGITISTFNRVLHEYVTKQSPGEVKLNPAAIGRPSNRQYKDKSIVIDMVTAQQISEKKSLSVYDGCKGIFNKIIN